jgi:hypothetical protein
MQRHEQKTIQKLLAELVRKKRCPFPGPGEKLEASKGKGVYIIYHPQGRVFHVGSTPRAKGGVAQRLRDHLAGRSSFVQKEFNGDGSQLRRVYEFQYLVVENGRRRALLEALGTGQLCPKHIGHGGDE